MTDFDSAPLRAKLRAVATKARTGTNRGLRLGAEHLLKEARDLVPHEEGVLENSGKVSVDEQQVASAVSFDTKYAVRQHEKLDYKHDDGRQAKYLETPMNTEGQVIAKLVQTEVKREMGMR